MRHGIRCYTQDPDTHRITDFFSFYTLPSTAIRMNPQQTINAAYLFYYATSSCPTCSSLLPNSSSQGTSDIISWDKETAEDRKRLKQRLNALMSDALIIANSVSGRCRCGCADSVSDIPLIFFARPTGQVRRLQRFDLAGQQPLLAGSEGEHMPAVHQDDSLLTRTVLATQFGPGDGFLQ